MRFKSPIQLHPSCDLAHWLPQLRDAEEGDGLSDGPGAQDFFEYLPTPLYDDGIQMRDMLMLRSDVTEVAARGDCG